MQVSQHEIESITYETKVFKGFACVTMTIKCRDGVQEIKLFANDIKNLTFVNEGIEVID